MFQGSFIGETQEKNSIRLLILRFMMSAISQINILAVIVAAIVAFVIGALWYGPLFGKQWMRYTGTTMEDTQKGNSTLLMFYGFLTALALSFVIAVLLQAIDVTVLGSMGGLYAIILLWLLTLPGEIDKVLWNKAHPHLICINGGYRLVQFILVALIIGHWSQIFG